MGNFGRDDRGGRGGYSGRAGSGFSRGGGRDFGRGFSGGSRGFNRGGDDRPREMFDATCDNCGKPCQVPFRPTSGKPVYCSDCFEKMGGRDGRGEGRSNDRPSFDRPRFEERAPRQDNQNKVQFDSLNAKLDKIISLLESKTIETVKVAQTPKVVKKAVKKLPEEKI